MTLDSLMSGLIGAVIGGVLTGVFSIIAVNKTEKHNRDSQAEADSRVLKGLLQALHDELESIFERYQETMGVHIESLPEGKPLLTYYPVINDFFTVYNANAFLIGRIENNDLRKSLVRTYILAKGLVDSYRMNNELLSKFEHWHALSAETNNPVHQQYAQDQFDALVTYGTQLKKGHIDVKKCVLDLMRMLHKRGVLHEA
ncbi:MAG: hypothetical protein KIT73_19195 [Burkholderiales bacterium]|nr:hypothetical protein [Burkholderiales bacterium]